MDETCLIERHQTLYHMAEPGTWPSIREFGLLSTEALLDHLGATPDDRVAILDRHRPSKIEHRGVFIRDQKPMNQNLVSCLKPANIQTEQWFRFLNRKVFFWATLERLKAFRGAYKKARQLIIEVPTKRMIEAHGSEVTLCHINSGATRMPNHFRSFHTFQSIASFEYSSIKKPAEFTVDAAVKDIAQLVSKVYEAGDCQAEVQLYPSD